MAITKNPFIRYKILDSFFRHPFKIYTIDVLLQELNDKLFEIFDNHKNAIKLRQLQEDIAFMKSTEGWGIEFADLSDGKKKNYRYENINFSINNLALNDIETNEFQAALLTLSHFEGMPQFEGISEIIAKLDMKFKNNIIEKPFIGFEQNADLKGIDNFGMLFQAVKDKLTLEIEYKDFSFPESYKFEFHPYYLKQYNNRWFILGLNPSKNKYDWNIALDRIVSYKCIDKGFIENEKIDFKEYFSDMIGVSKPENSIIETVILHFEPLTAKYMMNKPIHETQKNKWIDENTLEIKLNIIINYELVRFILSYADSVKVIAPLHLVDLIINKINGAQNLYKL
ncbi:WYL domain-containing protein [Flavobacterium branchiophilum NBRC 15030 = ATCC 35035]|uniref:Putative DNA-binding transcriptional regulator YafY n=1 Tax=Flavobacterium branchiophilum TaxID=55197 RepID=A0A543G842_9FLAO|nr:WYL domain-containing protein [Flavobacterium branchiophilum]OXA76960.1 WYL domain-containing protein [Flavobacterium branchiophilum NBRC 15030 = ATCC 35035]TQM42253.1 putative DNA-binding transcriptional regulator YafY [Flavobacterium branchiophilum]GEM54293.1 WYL domain-containing protein [Flavobacterium branchiophilum NBRC 15030 = ATCC 35035]